MAGRVTFRRTTNGDEIWGKQMGPDEKPTFDGLIARVAGGVEPLQTGWHTFTLADPGIGKLQVAGHDIGQFGHDQVYLEAGKRYPIEIKYSTHGRASDEQGIRLRWATPTGTWPGTLSPIPESQLYSN